jgi:hypothetical protein
MTRRWTRSVQGTVVVLLVAFAAGRGNAACLAGAEVGGACWFLGEVGESCSQVCDAAGFAYDQATRTFAGSDGTNANCVAVLDALNVIGGAVQDLPCDEDASIGCTFEPDLMAAGRIRCTRPTLPDAFVNGVQRACACQAQPFVPQGVPAMSASGTSAFLAVLIGLGAWGLHRRQAG